MYIGTPFQRVSSETRNRPRLRSNEQVPARLPIDPGHVRITVAHRPREQVERVELSPRQVDVGGPGVLFEAGGTLGTRNRHDVVPLGEKPREGDLSGGGAGLFGDRFHLGHDPEGFLEIALEESRTLPSEVARVELLRRANLARQEAATE